MIHETDIYQMNCADSSAVEILFDRIEKQVGELALLFGISHLPDGYKIQIDILDQNAFDQRKSLHFGKSAGSTIVAFSTVSICVVSYHAIHDRYTPEEYRFVLNVPYFDWQFNLGWWYVPFAMIVIAGASNGVNLSDGLDGLAAGLLSTVFAVFMVAAYLGGSALAIATKAPQIPQVLEMAVAMAAVVGACLGFLWFNAKPAQVFMGDTGSLALGAFLGLVAVMLKQEILLAVAGGVFVMESLSVMIQVGWFKASGGKRFFKMAPIHHHFEQLGWAETKVVFRFWLMGIVLAVAALTSF